MGVINTPSARFYDEGVHGLTVYDGTPDQKATLSASPYDWLEASFYYTNVQNRRYCPFEEYDFCKQDLKDKGFNVKIRLKRRGFCLQSLLDYMILQELAYIVLNMLLQVMVSIILIFILD